MATFRKCDRCGVDGSCDYIKLFLFGTEPALISLNDTRPPRIFSHSPSDTEPLVRIDLCPHCFEAARHFITTKVVG